MRRLQRDGHRCVVFDLNTAAVNELANEGATETARAMGTHLGTEDPFEWTVARMFGLAAETLSAAEAAQFIVGVFSPSRKRTA